MSALELVQSRCLRVQRNQGKPPTMLGAPIGVYRRLVAEFRGKGLMAFIHESPDPERSYIMVPLWDLRDGFGERAVEVFPDRDLCWER